MVEKVIPLKNQKMETVRAALEQAIMDIDRYDEVVILGKGRGEHGVLWSEMRDTTWWVGMLTHVAAELNFRTFIRYFGGG